MSQTAVIIFDFDGVLVESVDIKTKAFEGLYYEYGPEIVKRVIGYHLEHGGVSRYEKFRYFHETLLGIPLDEDKKIELADRFSKLVEDAVVDCPFVPGAREFLEDNYKKFALFVASGTPEDELKRIISRRGMSGYFLGTYGAPAKKGDILIKISKNYHNKTMLMVGDAMTDYQAASQAGIRFIGRVPEYNESPFPGNTEIIRNLTELAVYL